MKLFLLKQTELQGYDVFDSCVVCAEDADEARCITPYGENINDPESHWSSWPTSADQITAEYLGEARDGMPAGVVCASFNAG